MGRQQLFWRQFCHAGAGTFAGYASAASRENLSPYLRVAVWPDGEMPLFAARSANAQNEGKAQAAADYLRGLALAENAMAIAA
jgi:hypothetical protein